MLIISRIFLQGMRLFICNFKTIRKRNDKMRAKFKVNEKTEFPWNDAGKETTAFGIKMSAVFESHDGVDGNVCEENKIFGKYTPNGQLDMTIVNHAAANSLEVGKSYYMDFTVAE